MKSQTNSDSLLYKSQVFFRKYKLLILGIILFYICIAFAQYFFVEHQLYKNLENDLKKGANEISSEIINENGWQIESFDRAIIEFPTYQIIDTSGCIIHIEGFRQELIGEIDTIEERFYKQPIRIITKFNEHRKIFAKHLDSADLILSISQTEEITDSEEDSILYKTANLYGSDLKHALQLSPNRINNVVDVAIISSNHHILNTWGGIPLKITKFPKDYLLSHFQSKKTPKGDEYLYYKPITIRNDIVGVIIVYKDINDIEAALNNQILFNLGFVIIAFILTLIILIKSLFKTIPKYTIEQAIAKGEDEHIEFKETLIWDVNLNRANPTLCSEVIETIAGFSNSNGGQLFIGIADDGSVSGIDRDLHLFGGSHDQFKQRIVNSVSLSKNLYMPLRIENLQFDSDNNYPIYEQ